MAGEIGGIDGIDNGLRGVDMGLDGWNAALYSAPAGRAALNDLRDWPFPCPEAN